MTTQDIYAWTQIILLVVVGGGLAWYIRLLKRAVDAQKATIDAQAEQLKAQSTVLQDFERLNKTMKLVIDTVSDPAALQREQAYKERVDRDATALVARQVKEAEEKGKRTVSEVRDADSDLLHDFFGLTGRLLPFVPPDVRRTLIDATTLSPQTKDLLHDLEASAPPMMLGEVRRWADSESTRQLPLGSLRSARPQEGRGS
jgi:hypothetical protein